MAITMQGAWTVAVKSKSAAFAQRFIISNAASGNGTYAGDVGTPPVFVTGDHWSISIQNAPTAGHWVDSADQITFPTVAAGKVQFDIQSNDAGPDQDFNDLILTCSAPQTLTDFFLYGHVSYYDDFCIFNPCWRDWLVIETPIALANAKAAAEAAAPTVTSSRTVALRQSSAVATVDYDRLAVAGIVDHIFQLCTTGPLPGVALGFQQYDRTGAELSGGSYTGTGNREDLGVC